MRGRTNINGGGNVVVNGLVKEYTVAPESNIAKGDFVRLETKASTSLLLNERSESENRVKHIGKIANKKHVFLIDSTLYIIGIENKASKILSYYNQYKVARAAMSSDGIIYCALDLDVEPGVISLRIAENDTFVLENTAENAPDIGNAKYCSIIGNNFYVIYNQGFNSSNDVVVSSFDIKDSTINFKWKYRTQYSTGTLGTSTYDKIGDTLYFFSVIGNRYTKVYSINIDEDNSKFEVLEIGSYNLGTNVYELWSLGNNLLIPLNSGIFKLNVDTGDNTTISFSTLGMAGAKYVSKLSYPFENKIISYFYNDDSSIWELAVLSLDEQSNQLERLSNVLKFNPRIPKTETTAAANFEYFYYTAPVVCIADGDSILLIGQSSSEGYLTSLLTASEDYSTVMEGVDQNIVKPYDGKQSAIGFAKTGGTAVEKIKVYVQKEIV